MADQTQDQNAEQTAEQEAQNATNAAESNLAKAQQELNQARQDNDADKTENLLREIDRLRADNRKLKDESAERRVTAKETQEQNEKLRKVAQALGLETEDEDPEALLKAAREQADEKQREADKLRAELNRMREQDELRRIARENGADPEVIVPYLVGTGSLPQWGDDDYTDKAVQLVQNTMERHPAFSGSKVPRSSGQAPTPTKRNNDEKLTRDDIDRLVAQGDYAAVNRAVEEGRVEL